MANSNFVVKNGLTVNGSFMANSTTVNAAAVTATSYNISTNFVANSTTILVGSTTAGANSFTANGTQLSVGNSTVNTFSNATHFFAGNSTVYGYGNNTAEGLVNSSANAVLTAGSLVFNGVGSGYLITVGNTSVNSTINSTSFTGTSNNSLYLGGTLASGYQTTSGLGTAVATLTANAANYLGSQPSSNFVNSSQLSSNLSNYAALSGASFTGQVSAAQISTTGNGAIGGTLTIAGNLSVSSTSTNTFAIGTAAWHVANGNLGLGTNTPAYTLDVNGQIRSWSASGIYANNLMLQGDGTNATIRPTNSGSALNLGANNSNYAIVAANGNFGVNTTTPAYKVDVTGDVRATGNVIATNVNATNLNGAITSSQVTTALGFTPYNSTNPSNFANSTNSLNINGNANNITAYTINQNLGTGNSPTFTGLTTSANTLTIGTAAYYVANGNLGIATSTPAYKVDVSGDVRATGNVIGTNLVGAITSSQVTTALGFTPYNSTNPSNFANSTNILNINGNANNITAYTINQSVGTSNSPTFTGLTTSANTLTVGTAAYHVANGNLGIATSTPAYKIDVTGDVRATGNVIATNVNATNLNGAITSSQVTTALGYTPYNSTNPSNFANSTNSLNINGNAGNITAYTINQSVGTSNSPTFANMTLNGSLTATGNITAYYSDKRLKSVIGTIQNALDKVSTLSGVVYKNNDVAAKYGYTDQEEQVGVIAQEVQEVLPQVVKPAPFDTNGDGTSKSGENYMTVQYEKLVPLLIEAIKELKREVDVLKSAKFCQCP